MIKDGEVVGHAPATKIFQFLRRDVNKVTGTKVNQAETGSSMHIANCNLHLSTE